MIEIQGFRASDKTAHIFRSDALDPDFATDGEAACASASGYGQAEPGAACSVAIKHCNGAKNLL